jgi:hypothetical protein
MGKNMSGKVLARGCGLAVVLLLVVYIGAGVVDAQASPSPVADRSFSASPVPAGTGELVVTITARGYGRFGQVVETLPPDFIYKSSGLPGVETDGQRVVLTFLEGDSVTYMIAAPAGPVVRAFSGVIKDEDKTERQVGGQTQITVLATGLSLLERYDVGSIAGDGQIQRDEYLRALEHYIDGVITKAEYLDVLELYLG